MVEQKPKIVLNEETKTKLDNIGTKGETYDSIIQMLIKNYEDHILI